MFGKVQVRLLIMSTSSTFGEDRELKFVVDPDASVGQIFARLRSIPELSGAQLREIKSGILVHKWRGRELPISMSDDYTKVMLTRDVQSARKTDRIVTFEVRPTASCSKSEASGSPAALAQRHGNLLANGHGKTADFDEPLLALFELRRNEDGRDKVCQALVARALVDLRSAQKELDQVMEKCFRQEYGFVPRGGDVHIDMMTSAEAMVKALAIGSGCKAFTFKNGPTASTREVFFKNRCNVVQTTAANGDGWTTFLVLEHQRQAFRHICTLSQLMGIFAMARAEQEGGVEARILSLMDQTGRDVGDESFFRIIKWMLIVWPEITPALVTCMRRRLEWRQTATDDRLLKLLFKHCGTPQDPDLILCCERLVPQGSGLAHSMASVHHVAAKLLMAHAPRRHERAITALVSLAINLAGDVYVPVARALGRIAPQGHEVAIRVLLRCAEQGDERQRRVIFQSLEHLGFWNGEVPAPGVLSEIIDDCDMVAGDATSWPRSVGKGPADRGPRPNRVRIVNRPVRGCVTPQSS